MKKYIVHDYETFGKDNKKDKASQFAAFVTDENFNILEKHNFFCTPSLDYLPNPEACYVTGVTPIDILNYKKEGTFPVLSEYHFFQKIFDIFSAENSCIFGFNNLKFDDEVSRHGFYRNGLPPYDREFKGGNSRLDIINLVRLFAFIYPNDINILNTEGEVSFKLSDLAVANNFKMENAHDAFSDVETTLELAKFMKEKQPSFWNFWSTHNNKKEIQKLLDTHIKTTPFIPLLAYSTFFGKENSFVKPMICLGKQTTDYKDPNSANYLCLDITSLTDLKKFLSLSVEKAQELMFANKEEREKEGFNNIPIYTIKTNQLPLFITAEMFNTDSLLFNMEVSEIKNHIKEKSPDYIEISNHIKDNYSKIKSFMIQVLNNKKDFPACTDSDLGLYSQEVDLFKDYSINKWLGALHYNISVNKYLDYFNGKLIHDNPFIQQLSQRIILRNFLPDLKEECKRKKQGELWLNIISEWKKECEDKITKGFFNFHSSQDRVTTIIKDEFFNEIKEFENSEDTLKQKIAVDLKNFYSMLASFFPKKNKLDDTEEQKNNPGSEIKFKKPKI